jgi:hypothetical protein
VLDEGRKVGIPVPKLDAFRQVLERATETSVESGSQELSSFASSNDAKMAENLSKTPTPSRVARQLQGYKMEERTTDQSQPPTSRAGPSRSERGSPQ